MKRVKKLSVMVLLVSALLFGGATGWMTTIGIDAGKTLYSGSVDPCAYGNCWSVDINGSWQSGLPLEFQLQYYAPYGAGWQNTGAPFTYNGGDIKTNRAINGNYQHRMKFTNKSSQRIYFNSYLQIK